MSVVERPQQILDQIAEMEFCHVGDLQTRQAFCGHVMAGDKKPCGDYWGEAICPTCGCATCPVCAVRADLAGRLMNQ